VTLDTDPFAAVDALAVDDRIGAGIDLCTFLGLGGGRGGSGGGGKSAIENQYMHYLMFKL
jgi:hypothetical protein